MKIAFYFLLIFNVCLVSSSSKEKVTSRVTWADFTKYVKSASSEIIEDFKPFVFEHFPYGNVSEKCIKSLTRYVYDFKEWKPWAVKMADSTAKFPSGFIAGTKSELGTFHECLDISVNSNNVSDSFRGQFCMIRLRSELTNPLSYKTPEGKTYVEAFGYPPDWILDTVEEMEGFLSDFALHMGICIPSGCSTEEIHRIAYAFFNKADIKVSVTDCQTSISRKWPTSAVLAVCLIVCILGSCILGTVLDILDHQYRTEKELPLSESTNRKILKSFSFYTNIPEKWFETPKTQHTLDCLHGIRVLLCLWIVLAHVFAYPSLWKQHILTHTHRVFKALSRKFIFVETGILAMENFIHISGFMLGYVLWKKLEKSGGKLKYSELLLQKYLRYTPTYFVFLLIIFAAPMLYNGPIWNSTWEYEIDKCYNYGWKNLFYIQNFWTEHTEICWLHTWYISALIQIQTVSLFLMAFSYKYPKLGITAGVCASVVFFVRDFLVWKKSGLKAASPMGFKSFVESLNMVGKFYIQTCHHFSSHAIGMALGVVVAKYKDIKLSRNYQIIGWIMYITVSLITMVGMRIPTTSISASLYMSGATIIWSLSFSWLVFVCTTGSVANF